MRSNKYEINIKDKDDNIISNIFINSNLSLAPKEEKKVKNIVVGKDLSNAHQMELIVTN